MQSSLRNCNNNHDMNLLEANAQFCSYLFGFIKSMTLKCAVQLGIPEVIHNHGKPMSISELALSLPIHPQKVRFLPQVMRILTHLGFFYSETIPNEDEFFYSLTSAGELLLADHPFSTKPFLLFILDASFLKPWEDFSIWFQNEDQTAFHTAHGMHMWEYLSCVPEMNRKVNQTMVNDSNLVASTLIRTKVMDEIMVGISTLVDVGGGWGGMAKAIAHEFSNVKCMVLDLPHVVKGLEGFDNLTFIVGDMFQGIPPADAVLLKWVLHDWPDEDCVRILKQCREAITNKETGRRGKVVIIDIVVEEKQNNEDKQTEVQLLFDMEMLGMISAKERTEKEWKKLFEHSGFVGGYKIKRVLGFRSLIELYP